MNKKSVYKLLLVEDEETLGSTLSEQLVAEAYHVTWVQTAAGALEAAESEPFDLAIVDVGLPDGSGFDVAQKLRQQQHAMGIMFLTAWGTPENRVRGLELGAEDYVVKPFHLREFLLRIQACLKRARYYTGLSSDDEVEIGRARLSFSRAEAVVDGTAYSLSQKECSLLKLLIERRGRVVSRDEILDEVWSKTEFPTPRTIDNFVLRLRKLIEVNPDKPVVIRSVRGVGYQLE